MPGVVAVWTYEKFRVNPSVDAVMDRFYVDVIGPYWPPERWPEDIRLMREAGLSVAVIEARPRVGGRAVTEADLRAILGEGRRRSAEDGRETVHAFPLGFTMDATPGAEDPRGEAGHLGNGVVDLFL